MDEQEVERQVDRALAKSAQNRSLPRPVEVRVSH
jgi:hypothetical protein